MSENKTDPAWRDPLSIGWQAHRGLLLLRLRWHSRERTDQRASRAATTRPASMTSGGPSISKSHPTIAR